MKLEPARVHLSAYRRVFLISYEITELFSSRCAGPSKQVRFRLRGDSAPTNLAFIDSFHHRTTHAKKKKKKIEESYVGQN
jgi:hypothetical protein